MNQYIEITVTNNLIGSFSNGGHLLNIKDILYVRQTSAQMVSIALANKNSAKDILTLSFATLSGGAPAYSTSVIRNAIQDAMTSNPGANKAVVIKYPKDSNGNVVQCNFLNYV